MGIYLNPGNENFRESAGSKIYVDKTMMIKQLNEFMDYGNKYVCISRPRRFGKTIAGNMLAAYYSKGCDSADLFAPYKISADPGFSEKLNKYNVIQIDMNSEYQNAKDKNLLISRLQEKIIKELHKAFPDAGITDSDSLGESLLNVYGTTGQTFIIIIDEYDVLVREQVNDKLFDEFLERCAKYQITI